MPNYETAGQRACTRERPVRVPGGRRDRDDGVARPGRLHLERLRNRGEAGIRRAHARARARIPAPRARLRRLARRARAVRAAARAVGWRAARRVPDGRAALPAGGCRAGGLARRADARASGRLEAGAGGRAGNLRGQSHLPCAHSNSGIPEELLGGVLCVVAVLLAARERPLWAGLASGLAIANKEWALLAVGPVLFALPRAGTQVAMRGQRRGCVCRSCSRRSLSSVSSGFVAGPRAARPRPPSAIFQPWQIFWFFGHYGPRVGPFDVHRPAIGRTRLGRVSSATR